MDTPSIDPQTSAGDPVAYAAHRQVQEELYRAAVAAMRLLQDRQHHTPEEHLDSRETTVLRQLRAAIRVAG